MIPPLLFFLLKITLAKQELLCFHTSFSIFSIYVKNRTEILIGIALNL
jgi:hypothetical protein